MGPSRGFEGNIWGFKGALRVIYGFSGASRVKLWSIQVF